MVKEKITYNNKLSINNRMIGKKIKNWNLLHFSSCQECVTYSLMTFFVHATNPDNNKIGPNEIDDYQCSLVRCNCNGKYMGHYVRKCQKCNAKFIVEDEEIDLLD